MEGVVKKLIVRHAGQFVAWAYKHVSGRTRERVVLGIGVVWSSLWFINAYLSIILSTWISISIGLIGYSASVSILAWIRSYRNTKHVNRDLVLERAKHTVIAKRNEWKIVRNYTVRALAETSQATHFSRPSAEVDIDTKARHATLERGTRRARVVYKANFKRTLKPGEIYNYTIIENVLDEKGELQTYYATKFDYFSSTEYINICIKFRNIPETLERYGEDRFTENYVIPKETAPTREILENGKRYHVNDWEIENPMETCWYTFKWHWK